MRIFFLLAYLALSTPVFALSCKDTEGAFELSLDSLGIVYFQDVNSKNDNTLLTLFNGVCLIAQDGWQVESSEISVFFKDDGSFLMQADGIDAQVFDWEVQALKLEAYSDTLILYDLNLKGQELAGSAAEARFEISTGDISFKAVEAKTKALRVLGETATLNQDTLILQDAVATTCTCDTDALYVIEADEIGFSYTSETLSVSNGHLKIGTLDFELGNRTFSRDTFAQFQFPITIDYSEDDSANNIRGTGLGVLVPKLAIDKNFSLEFGIFGLDSEYPLRNSFLANYASENLSFTIGNNIFGPQADFSYRQELLPWLKADFSMLNRHWLEQDFSHDASLSLLANYSLKDLNLPSASVSSTLFAAASSQTLSTPITSARLGGKLKFSYSLNNRDWGQLSSSLEGQEIFYPSFPVQQYGVNLNLQWRKNLSPKTSVLIAYNRQWTNSGSPFSSKIDRLSPSNTLSFNFSSAERLSPEWSESISFRSSYDLLADLPGFTAFSDLALTAQLKYQSTNWSLSPYLDSHLEGLLNPNYSALTDAYLDTGLRLEYEELELGSKLRFDLRDSSLDSWEFSSGFPLSLGNVALRPFIAMDIMPSLTSGELPRISGHGLNLSWTTCCGILDVGYKQYNNQFATSFGVRFE
ncbi:MAG: hypothetical protein KC422_11850 [Trueperaceae bacterium]|nr:hypothetical protein [Trueperaceae bacterium]